MRVAIMQPYFLPYIGYWQLINAADTFVVYDNIEYTKKGWFNRNRILEDGHDRLFTVPIKKESDFLPINQRHLSDDSDKEINRNLRIIQANYKKAPFFSDAYPVIEECFSFDSENLFDFIFNSIQSICRYLDIATRIVISSTIEIDHSLKSSDKIIALCRAEKADVYINPIGGKDLYESGKFKSSGIDLKFLKSKDIEYEQFGKPFVSWLSIIDVMMFNEKAKIKSMLEDYSLL